MVTDSGGKVVTFTFTGSRITSVVDPLGSVWTFEYTNDSLTQVSHGPTGYTWQFAYDTNSYLLSYIRDPDCTITALSFANGTEPGLATYGTFLGSSIRGKNYNVTFSYPQADQVQTTDAAGHTYTYSSPEYMSANTPDFPWRASPGGIYG
jgi:uncharacterized protein RhaS with RHS repeats